MSSSSSSKARKRRNSILLRLTASQVWRSIMLNIKIDLLIMVIAVAIAFCYINFQASKAVKMLQEVDETIVEVLTITAAEGHLAEDTAASAEVVTAQDEAASEAYTAAWDAYEEDMLAYGEKMEAYSQDMLAYDDQMQAFASEMQDYEAELQDFDGSSRPAPPSAPAIPKPEPPAVPQVPGIEVPGGYADISPSLQVSINDLGESIYSYIDRFASDATSSAITSEEYHELGPEAISVLEKLLGFEYYTSTHIPYSFRYPDRAANLLSFPQGTLGRLEFDWLGGSDLHFKYLVIIPTSDELRYAFLAFDLLPLAGVLLAGFVVLAAFQLLMVLFGIFGIRRSTKKILKPINELAAAARFINTAPPPNPARQELKLDGAIDTLNTITENHLDTRISIDDEREELKGLASAINAMLDRLDAAYRAQLRFVSDASHELRTPIAVIQGYANLLDRWGKRDEKALQESIDAIKSEAHGMEGLVEQLLFLARSDNNTLKTDMQEIDMSALTEEIVKETTMIDSTHKIVGAIDEDLIVYGDPQLLKQAMRIFVDNAIKYTPEGGRIRIAGHREGDKVRLSVSDTGIGIAEKDLSQVFERFFRADESRTRKTGGTGLGLSIARYIIDRHGGYMEITSRENIGTRITAIIPAQAAGAAGGDGTPPGPAIVPPTQKQHKQKEYRRPEAV